MPYRRTTLSKFIIEDQRRTGAPDHDLTSLLNDIQTACKLIAIAASRGRIPPPETAIGTEVPGEQEASLDAVANDIMVGTCEWGGQLTGMVSRLLKEPHPIPSHYPRGRLLLVVNPADGSPNIDINMPVGTIFSVLRCPDLVEAPGAADFLQPGTTQVAAGYAMYGPTTMVVLTVGDGVHGFTLDREIGAFVLTHPGMAIPADSSEFAVNVSNERFWERPVRRYVDECLEGAEGPRGTDFNMRWVASMVAEVHRILIRGGLFMHPRDTKDPGRAGRPRLLYEANPIAMIVEQAGGAASTGRARLLEVTPTAVHQPVPVILGSRHEVERLERYHAEHDAGLDEPFAAPLFNARSLFRTA